MGESRESRENAQASGEAARGRVLARLTLLTQTGELARRLTRAPRTNPRAAINEGREEEKITSILVSSQRLIVTSWFAIALAAGMRVRRI